MFVDFSFFFKFVIGCWYTVLGIVLAFILLIGIGGSATAGNSWPFLIMSGMAAGIVWPICFKRPRAPKPGWDGIEAYKAAVGIKTKS